MPQPAERPDLSRLRRAAERPFDEGEADAVQALAEGVLGGVVGCPLRALALALLHRVHLRRDEAARAERLEAELARCLEGLPPGSADGARAAMVWASERGRTLALRGHPDRAVHDFLAARSLADELEAERVWPLWSVYVGNAQTRLGAFDEAMAAYEEALHRLDLLAQEGHDDRSTRGLALHNLAVLYGEVGDLVEAIDTCRRADEIYGGARLAVLDSLALFLSDVGEHDEARAVAERAVARARDQGDVALVLRTVSTLGSVAGAAGDVEGARQAFEEALGLLDQVDYLHGEMAARTGLASVCLDEGDGGAALEVLWPLFAEGREQVDARWEPRVLRLRARAHRQLGQLERCIELLEAAHELEVRRARAEADERLQQLRVRHEVHRAQRVAARMARARMAAEEQLQRNARRLRTSLAAEARARLDRDTLEDRLVTAQRLQAVGLLSGGIAHDINNLLTVSFAYLDLFAMEGEQEQSEALAHAREANQRIAGLTQQLLSLSRGVGGAEGQVSVDPFVRQTGALLQGVLEGRIELVTRADAEGERLAMKAGHLEQVLLNLVVNARDAITGTGRIEVSTAVRRGPSAFGWSMRWVELVVSDTGCGMTPEVLRRVSEPLFTTKPEGRGTGLGLSTVASLVERYGGELALDSEVGVGTTVTVRLPVAPEGRWGEVLQGKQVWVVAADPAQRAALAGLVVEAGGVCVASASLGELESQGEADVTVVVDGDEPALARDERGLITLPDLASVTPQEVIEALGLG